jgi:hypothetical protein
MTQEKALIKLGDDYIGYIEMNRGFSILTEINIEPNIVLVNYTDIDNLKQHASFKFTIFLNGQIGIIGIIPKYFNDNAWNYMSTNNKVIVLIDNAKQPTITFINPLTFVRMSTMPYTRDGGSLRRIKKRTRRHKKKRGKRTRNNRSKR